VVQRAEKRANFRIFRRPYAAIAGVDMASFVVGCDLKKSAVLLENGKSSDATARSASDFWVWEEH